MVVATNVINDCCPIDNLCDRCVADGFAQLRGVAQNRGHFWAVDLETRVRDRDQPWPNESEAVTRISLMKVEDLTRDPRLRLQLAGELVKAAARRWSR